MTINTARTEIDGRRYEVVADSDKRSAPMGSYVQIYRLRKDGTRGRRLQSHRTEGWNVWKSVKDQIQQAEGVAL